VPATALDHNTALVVIDLQKGIMAHPTVHPVRDVLFNAARLAEGFRRASLPVALVRVAFSLDGHDRLTPRSEVPARPMPASPEFSELASDLAAAPGDLLIVKRQWNAFYGTELDLQLRRRKVTGIVLAGIATSIGVDSTARAAYERAYNVTFASDAMTDIDPAAHECAMTKIFPRIGEIDSTDAILALLAR
jgi:nicotinamidase-related amidase